MPRRVRLDVLHPFTLVFLIWPIIRGIPQHHVIDLKSSFSNPTVTRTRYNRTHEGHRRPEVVVAAVCAELYTFDLLCVEAWGECNRRRRTKCVSVNNCVVCTIWRAWESRQQRCMLGWWYSFKVGADVYGPPNLVQNLFEEYVYAREFVITKQYTYSYRMCISWVTSMWVICLRKLMGRACVQSTPYTTPLLHSYYFCNDTANVYLICGMLKCFEARPFND